MLFSENKREIHYFISGDIKEQMTGNDPKVS